MKTLIDHPALKDRAGQKPTQKSVMIDDWKIAIDGVEYALTKALGAMRESLNDVRAVDLEIQGFKMHVVVGQSACGSYAML